MTSKKAKLDAWLDKDIAHMLAYKAVLKKDAHELRQAQVKRDIKTMLENWRAKKARSEDLDKQRHSKLKRLLEDAKKDVSAASSSVSR